MATDVLSTPLGYKDAIKKRIWPLPIGWISAGLSAAVMTTMALWVVFVDDPFGGEPVAVVTIERQAPGVTIKDVEVVDVRPSLPSGDDPSETAADDPDRPPPPEIEFTDDLASDVGTRFALSTTPEAKLTEKGKYGTLPRIAEDGSRPLDLYAAPVARGAVEAPKIVLVVNGLGLSQTGTQEAIRLLPSGVTLGFAPYGSSLERWVQRARQEGHELLLQLPLEPFDFPDNDPGPHTLLTKLSETQNRDRLHWLLARITNYVGVVNYMGARFTANREVFSPVMRELEKRGLLFFDDGSSSRSVADKLAKASKAPFAKADMTIDFVATPEQVDARLLQLEALARSRGLAVGVASALPVSIERIAEWAEGLEARGVYLVPPSYVARSDQPG